MDSGQGYFGSVDGVDAGDLALTVRLKLRAAMNASRAHPPLFARHAGIAATQLAALAEIQRNPGIRIGEFARRHEIKSCTASNLLHKLEARGWLRRERNQPDLRVVRLFLTVEGGRILAGLPMPASSALTIALSRVPRDALAALDQGLDALVDLLEDTGPSAQPPPANAS